MGTFSEKKRLTSLNLSNNLELDPLAVLHLNNRLQMTSRKFGDLLSPTIFLSGLSHTFFVEKDRPSPPFLVLSFIDRVPFDSCER